MTVIGNLQVLNAGGQVVATTPITQAEQVVSIINPEAGEYTLRVEHLIEEPMRLKIGRDLATGAGFPIRVMKNVVTKHRYASPVPGHLNVTYTEDAGTGPVYIVLKRAQALPGFGASVLREGDTTRYDSGYDPRPPGSTYTLTSVPIDANVEYVIEIEIDTYSPGFTDASTGRIQLQFTPS